MDSLERVETMADHLLNFAGVTRPPAPLELAHAVADVRIYYVDWRFHHGFTYRRRGVFHIAINSNDSEPERRFTLFHELYHVIEHRQPAVRQLASADWHGELLADHFALSVLLNDRWFGSFVRAYGDDVDALAGECGVSPDAVRWKLKAGNR